MTLMTAEIEKKFEKYPFTSQEKEGMNATVIAKFYNPCGNDVWLITEAEKQENGNWLLFGLINIFNLGWEWGYVLLSELEKMELDQWNYSLDEIDHIEELNLEVVIVRFLTDIKGKYEYRFCEITDYTNW